MDTKDYFKNLYSDFYGTKEIPKIVVKNEDNVEFDFDDTIKKIDDIYINEESKTLLKNIITYMYKYSIKEEENYIPFNIILEANNKIVKKEVEDILYSASKAFSYIKNNSKKEISLYSFEKNIDFNSNSFIVIDNLDGINLEEENTIKKFFHSLEEFINLEEKKILILSDTKENITKFFLGRENIKNDYLKLVISSINPDNQDVYNYVLEKVNIDENLRVELLDYISKTYNKELDYVSYEKDLVNYISFNKSIPKLSKEKTMDEVFAELNELVGLSKVKKVLYDLVDVITLKKKTEGTLNIKDINLHMVFLGNPGTGKTTIARIISGILYNLGYIKENKLIEVSSKDLVAEYVGQTAPKTMSVIEKSMNGVLFIDEAYTLAVKGDNSYNAEAIATLIQSMENYRDKLVVIFAGYTKEMQDFLDSNSGITSRIGYTLEFDDYTTDELISIFNGMIKKAGFVVTDDAISYLREVIDQNRNVKNFGNARFVRNIYEKTIIKHASNVKDKKQKNILKTITKDDISIDNLILSK